MQWEDGGRDENDAAANQGDPGVLATPGVEETRKPWASMVRTTPRFQTSGLQTHETTHSFWFRSPSV